jgi:hypothetical protein
MPDLKTDLRVEIAFNQPANLDVLDDISDALRKIADVANVPNAAVRIDGHEYEPDTKVAKFSVAPKEVG